MGYSAQFNNVLEVLNLFLKKHVAGIQLPGNDIQWLPIT